MSRRGYGSRNTKRTTRNGRMLPGLIIIRARVKFIRRSRCCNRKVMPLSMKSQGGKREQTYIDSAWLRAPTILMHSLRLETISGDSFNSSSRISGSGRHKAMSTGGRVPFWSSIILLTVKMLQKHTLHVLLGKVYQGQGDGFWHHVDHFAYREAHLATGFSNLPHSIS